MSQLVVVEGPDMGRTHILGDVTRIGNGRESDVVLSDRRAKGCEALIKRSEGAGYFLQALAGSKAITLNGEPVDRALLQHGDMIALGRTKLLYSEDTPATGAARGGRMGEEAPTADVATDLMGSQIISRREHYRDVGQVLEPLRLADRSSQRLASLYRVASVACEVLDLSAILDAILVYVFRDLPADRAIVVLSNPGDSRGKEYIWDRKRGRMSKEAAYSRTIIDHVLATKESVLTANAMDDSRFISGQSILDQSVVSAMCVPLKRRERVFGALQLDTFSALRAFSKEDLDYLEKIGIQAAVAVENALIHAQPRVFSESLKRLSHNTQCLSSYLEREPIVKEGVGAACTQCGFSKVSILLVDEASKSLRLAYAKGIAHELWKDIVVPIGEGICGRVAQRNEVILYPDPRTGLAPEGVAPTWRTQYLSRSFLVVPIRAKADELGDERRIVGVLCATDKFEGEAITEIERELLTILANQVGVALTNAELYERATVDPLTRLYVRRYFFQRLAEEIERTREEAIPLSLLMLDLDHFKRVNDTYGHPMGDVVLREVGAVVRSTCRSTDIPARYGGEEFVVFLPETGIEEAHTLAESIRASIEGHPYRLDGGSLAMTVSIGVGALREGDSPESIVKRADSALYRAKERGRNRVVVLR